MVKQYVLVGGSTQALNPLSSNLSTINSNNDMKCAPSKKFEDGSCLTLDLLVLVAKAYNMYNNENQIKLETNLNKKEYKKYLVKEIENKLSNICTDQKCWIKQKFIKQLKENVQNELKTNTFRPDGPKGKFTWLNTVNINEVMSQYELIHSDFKFLGAVPVDFADLYSLNINLDSLTKFVEEGKTRLGIIFNLDEHYKSGSHWVAAYTDIKKCKVYFFDSVGEPPERRINDLLNIFETLCKKYNNNSSLEFKRKINQQKHQYKGTECGVYSINFILRLLKGDTFERIEADKVPDNTINKCRDVYFTK